MIDFIVPSLSRSKIRDFAHAIRFKLDSGKPYFEVVRFLDVIVCEIESLENFKLAIVPDSEMQGVHALADPDGNRITVTQSTYDGARKKVGRDRMTLIHEFGHLWLHKGVDLRFARSTQKLRAFESAEWQAKAFAGEFMIPYQYIGRHMSEEHVAQMFGVSIPAARYQISIYRKEGLI